MNVMNLSLWIGQGGKVRTLFEVSVMDFSDVQKVLWKWALFRAKPEEEYRFGIVLVGQRGTWSLSDDTSLGILDALLKHGGAFGKVDYFQEYDSGPDVERPNVLKVLDSPSESSNDERGVLVVAPWEWFPFNGDSLRSLEEARKHVLSKNKEA